ncbi:MAG: BLUF domain-containing protein [Burkholderiales bacterium]
MPSPTSQKTLLYVSELAEGEAPSVVGAITKAARVSNANRGIGGLLIFDGARFAQMLEGPPDCIDDLLLKLQADARHTNMSVLDLSGLNGPVRFKGWGLGFLLLEDEDQGILLLSTRTGEDAITTFLTLSSMADVDADVGVVFRPQASPS